MLARRVLPFLAVVLIAVMGWRWTYASAAILVGVTLIPATLWLLSNHHTFIVGISVSYPPRERSVASNAVSWTRGASTTRRQVLCHGSRHTVLADDRDRFLFSSSKCRGRQGLVGEWITGAYIFYALAGIITVLLAGPLIDRFRAERVIQIMLIPL